MHLCVAIRPGSEFGNSFYCFLLKNKTVDAVKKTYRKGKDEVSKMVNGKMECLAKKGVNKVKDGADAVGTKATEIKNKAD